MPFSQIFLDTKDQDLRNQINMIARNLEGRDLQYFADMMHNFAKTYSDKYRERLYPSIEGEK